MRTLFFLVMDLTVVAAATILALFVRDEFVFDPARMVALGPYLLTSVVLAGVVFPALGLDKPFWRYAGLSDLGRLLAAVLLVVISSYILFFIVYRGVGLPRSLPVLQGLLILFALGGVRALARLRQQRHDRPVPLSVHAAKIRAAQTVLVIGQGRLAELYLRAIGELPEGSMQVAGLLGTECRHVGRLLLGHRVLGTANEVETVLQDLVVHGLDVTLIAVAMAVGDLNSELRASLLRLEKSSGIRVQFVNEQLAGPIQPEISALASHLVLVNNASQTRALKSMDIRGAGQRRYWGLKRCIDVVGSALLLTLLSPAFLLLFAVVALTLGRPVMFWQSRPGLGGTPFRLYKFRSMAAQRDAEGRQRTDLERKTSFGTFLRRSRLDELPQLVSILVGDMSFVGPRPLIQAEQTGSNTDRLLVRPGLTGWAQVMGGRDISLADKMALDIWYLHNASLLRDVEIVLRTIPLVITGERVNRDAIKRAWREVELAGLELRRGAFPSVPPAGVRSVISTH